MPQLVWPAGFRERVEAFRHSRAGLRAGHELLDAGIYRFRSFAPVVIDLFADWTVDPVGNRSWQWHAASFNFMPWLIAVHAETGDQRAVDHAGRAIESWHRNFVAVESRYEFAWHDHATANRLMAVLALLCHLDEYPAALDADALIPHFLEVHGERLCRDEMYSRHTNHGIDQSRALLLLATSAPYLTGASRWREIALARLDEELEHAFAPDGGHVENSPAYHQFVSSLFADLLHTFGDTLESGFRERLRQKLREAARFMAWIVRPDGRLPPIGDTESRPASNVYRPLLGTEEYAHVQWACSRGHQGVKPAGTTKLFAQSGYFVARNDWEQDVAPADACHLVFRCGHLSDYHRHDDDLSLTFWWGADWFLDGGAYAYTESHPVRRYLRSKWAHNVVVVDGEQDGWDRPGADAPGDLELLDTGTDQPAARARTQSYPGLDASREVLMLPGGAGFEVHDSLCPHDGGKRRFMSLWHVPADKTVRIEGQRVTISDANFLRDIVIHNKGAAFDDIRILDTLPDGSRPVWSRELNRLDRCKVLVFERFCQRFESRLEFHLEDRRPDHRVAGGVHERARALFRSYGLVPADWWPRQGAHHARKIAARVEQAGSAGVSAEAFLESVLALAIVRQGHHAPTLHLSTMGYPDAGLLEPRLWASLGMHRAGEVYLPAPVQRVIRDWPESERRLFVDAVHLLHAAVRPGPAMLNSVVNSSQGQYQEVFWRGDENAVRVLALREPVDAVLNAMAHVRPAAGWRNAADAESALTRQVERLERFAAWMPRQDFALVFRIEDFLRDPAPVLVEIGQVCHATPNLRALTSLPAIAPLPVAQQALELEALHGLPARLHLRERLAGVSAALGYG